MGTSQQIAMERSQLGLEKSQLALERAQLALAIERAQLTYPQGLRPIPQTQTFQNEQTGGQAGGMAGPLQQGIPPGTGGQPFGFQGGVGQQGIPQAGPGQQVSPQPLQGENMFVSPFSFQGWTEPQYGPQVKPSQSFSAQGGAAQKPVGALSIEEGFSRFFILQGVTFQLKQFGYNFFDFPVSTFSPVMDVPVGPDYVVGPDDTLSISIWNVPDAKFNKTHVIPIGRDGTIFVPNVGAIPLAGQNFSEAKRLIMARLGNLLKRFEAHISMARLRTIKVYVVGEVVRPGAYEISSLAAASNAIYAACGPSKSGSLRQIRIVREGKVVAELDFYDFLLKGDRSKDVRLQGGDTILIPPVGKVTAVAGPVRRPAIYELTGKTTLTELIELAGGLAPTADRKRCHIFRIDAGQNHVILDVDLDKAQDKRSKGKEGGIGADPLIQDGDFVRINSVTMRVENAIGLTGAVKSPGLYELKPGMRLRDLLSPDQMLMDAYLDRAELIRTDPITYAASVVPFSLKRLFEGSAEDNIELKRLDRIVVTTQLRLPSAVSVTGEVKRPGLYPIELGERLSSVLKRTGGFTERSFPQGLILVRQSVKASQQIELQRFVTAQKQQLLSQAASYASGGEAGASQVALPLQLQQLDALAALTPQGRVVVKMKSNIGEFETTSDDVVLEDGDLITIPQPPQTVALVGAVRSPTTVVYREGATLDDYIKQAGGFIEEANQKEIYVVRANGSTDAAYVKVKPIQLGDTIVVPPKADPKYRTLTLWQSIATVIGAAAVTAASLAVIGR
jgi:protein involved in polysaccharide export with SLBB domain